MIRYFHFGRRGGLLLLLLLGVPALVGATAVVMPQAPLALTCHVTSMPVLSLDGTTSAR